MVGFRSVICIQHIRRFSPTYQVEETVAFHGEFQSAFEFYPSESFILSRHIGIRLYSYLYAISAFIVGNHGHALLCPVPYTVYQVHSIADTAFVELDKGLRPHQKHIGIPQYDMVHGRSPVRAFDQISAVRIHILLQ